MRFYALETSRMIRQIVGDLFVVVWVVAWWIVGRTVGDIVRAAISPINRAATLSGDIEAQLQDAANQAGSVPLVGGNLRGPFDDLAATVGNLATTSTDLIGTIEQSASTASWVVFLIPALTLVAVWLPRRLRFARRSSETLGLTGTDTGRDLLAFRALATLPFPQLQAVASDPVGAWRSGDPDVVARLAELELVSAGVARPARRR